jgi:hypothetical protein
MRRRHKKPGNSAVGHSRWDLLQFVLAYILAFSFFNTRDMFCSFSGLMEVRLFIFGALTEVSFRGE